ncbi:MAG TPA: CHAT domain-containing protein [Acidobacteriaceae bacterium]|nr:CHAT domain-containing protein [Acidobacteriaceae bacterium]
MPGPRSLPWLEHGSVEEPAAERMGTRRNIFRKSGCLLVGLVGLVLAPNGSGQTAANPAAATQLRPGATIDVDIPAHGKRTLSFSLCQGCFADVQIEQLRWMISAYPSGPGLSERLRYTTDAGLHSVIHIPVTTETAGQFELEIDAAVPNPAAVRVTLTEPRPTVAGDRDRVMASEALARAEQLRRTRGPNAAVLAAYDQSAAAAQKAGDTRVQLQALLGKARERMYNTGDYRAALETSMEAMAIVGRWPGVPQSQEDLALKAFAWKGLASAYSFLAQYPEMIDATNHSLALYEQLGDLYWQGILDGNAANVYLETGDMQHALSTAERALAIARQLSDEPGVAFTQATLGMIYQQRGEYQSAFDADHGALDTLERVPGADEEGQVWMNLAELYDAQSDPERERDALRESLPLLRQSRDTANESAALCDMGLLDLREHRMTEARELLGQSMQIAASHGLGREQALASLGQAELLADEQRDSEARAALESGLALAAKTSEVATSALLLQEEGDLDARRGDAGGALTAYRKAESIWSGIPNLEHAALARASMARLEARSGDLAEAHDNILLALDGFEASRRNIGGRSLRESFFASVHDFYDLAIELDMRGGSPAQTGEALEIAERARARSLMDAVRASSAFSSADVPRSVIDESAEIERQIAATQQAISHLGLTGNHGSELQQDTSRLHGLVLRSDDVEARERETASPSLFDAGFRPATLPQLRQKLVLPGTALLEYWVGRRNVYRWVITATSVQGVRLCSASTLDAAVEGYRQALLAYEQFPANEDLPAREARLSSAAGQLDRGAATLAGLLIPQSLPASVHRLVIVPDGLLASIPFAALRLRAAEYLIQRYELVEEPSASVATELLARAEPAHGQDRVAVFADPVYNQFDPRLAQHPGAAVIRVAKASPTDAPVLRNDAGFDLSALPRLSGSLREAHAIASIAGNDRVQAWLGFQATPAEVMHRDWHDFSIVHFATHAIVDPVHPELSGIILSTLDREASPQDGILWLHDIYRTPMPVSLVVLSGCRTASGKSIPGEGISGLAQAFLSSGASGVIGTLWSVDDRAAGEMIPWFYRALIDEHLGVAGALREAQMKMLAQHQSPYDWAGYVVEGNWRASASPRMP